MKMGVTQRSKTKEMKDTKLLRYAPFSDPIPCPVLFLSQFFLPVIVVLLLSVVLIFSGSQPVRSF